MDIKDKVISFYKEYAHLHSKKARTPNFEPLGGANLAIEELQNLIFFNANNGVGDTLATFHLPKFFKKHNLNNHIYSNNRQLMKRMSKYNPDIDDGEYNKVPGDMFFEIQVIQSSYDFGGGHWFQNIQKALGFEMDLKPKADLIVPNAKKQKGKVAMNFTAGADQERQKREEHPRARELYPEHRETIQKFINDNLNKYSFVEVDTSFSGFENVENKCGMAMDDSIEEIATCEYYLGIVGGIMHVATALELKCIIIMNFPSAKNIYMPQLVDTTLPELDWIYPQNVHLHEDDDGDLVKFLDYDNLQRAFDGEIYPFWKEDYLSMFQENFGKYYE